MIKENIDVPLVAIGGIERSDISSLFALGVNGIALSGSVLNANNPSHEIALILKEINRQVYG
jgi:thiamine-phosphate pyrophosphorylase